MQRLGLFNHMGHEFFLSVTFLGKQILTQYYQPVVYELLCWWTKERCMTGVKDHHGKRRSYKRTFSVT